MQSLILLSGCLAAGKTTLAEAIVTARTDFALAREDMASVPLFELWGKQNLKHVVLLQTSFYCTTVANILKAAAIDKHIIVADHSPAIHHHIYSKVLWQRGMLSDSDWDICNRLYEAVDRELLERFRVKHLLLPVAAEILEERLQHRRRDGGDAIPLALIQDYCDAFATWSVSHESAFKLTQAEAHAIHAGEASEVQKVTAFVDT